MSERTGAALGSWYVPIDLTNGRLGLSAPQARLREAMDIDAVALMDLIGAIYAEYPGCVLDPEGVDADLITPRGSFARAGGRLWVVESTSGLLACVGISAVSGDVAELKRLYVCPSARRTGLGAALVSWVSAVARARGAIQLTAWSDTRFAEAHRLYKRLGLARTGRTRELDDPSNTTEFEFVGMMSGGPAGRTVAWRGPFGRERCRLTAQPDGWLLTGRVGPAGSYEVTTDERWRTRSARLGGPGIRDTCLVADGLGGWWQHGHPVAHLAGVLDVDLGITPSTNTLPIRRLRLRPGEGSHVAAAWVRGPGQPPQVIPQRYERLDGSRWRYRSGRFDAVLRVDRSGLVDTYGAFWNRI